MKFGFMIKKELKLNVINNLFYFLIFQLKEILSLTYNTFNF
jgi:hypothetical protein